MLDVVEAQFESPDVVSLEIEYVRDFPDALNLRSAMVGDFFQHGFHRVGVVGIGEKSQNLILPNVPISASERASK